MARCGHVDLAHDRPVIKRITFLSRGEEVGAEQLAAEVAETLASVSGADLPRRTTVGVVLPELCIGSPRHDVVVLEWFADPDDLRRCGRRVPGEGTVVVAEEVVVRGQEWFGNWWEGGRTTLTHLALARRAVGLSPSEFSERWRAHAGHVGPPGAMVVIPDDVRGLAYVQDHPLPRPEGEWPYDAVNEVRFDDPDGLRARVEWFRDHGLDQPQEGLTRQSWFLAVREDVILPAVAPRPPTREVS